MHSNRHECGRHGGRRAQRFGGRFEAFAREMGEQIAGEFGGGRRGGGPGGFGRGRGRVFDSAELRLVLLAMIAEAPRHGYDLIKAIEARSGGVYAPSPGMVYPTLTLIADEGLVDEVADGSRKRFTVTDAGRAVIDAEAAVIADAMARLEALAKLRAPTDAAPIRRAMRNLHSAVHGRLSADGVDREIQLQVAAILDEAAGRIERL
ncbi:PadR family transcriptional regulator [Polymorphobacter fuscus]|uniref:PadR family transcriptional regulator n=2 Tax=Sandarakinorhabdus fusca TaxID=1439888 RepID=A0A7C9KM80_9SPHN|nr:helix-turn-helix transcriptional regulator [Polymorphobacter fuscus]MQT17643.1 PadR family transcriptional regulator [Polymorphobacter fuscus]